MQSPILETLRRLKRRADSAQFLMEEVAESVDLLLAEHPEMLRVFPEATSDLFGAMQPTHPMLAGSSSQRFIDGQVETPRKRRGRKPARKALPAPADAVVVVSADESEGGPTKARKQRGRKKRVGGRKSAARKQSTTSDSPVAAPDTLTRRVRSSLLELSGHFNREDIEKALESRGQTANKQIIYNVLSELAMDGILNRRGDGVYSMNGGQKQKLRSILNKSASAATA